MTATKGTKMQIENVKRGMKVLIKKGTPIRSTGSVRDKVAGRDYVVTVHHTLNGVKVTADTALADRYFKEKLVGLGINEDDLLALRASNPEAYYNDVNIELESPKVVWAGAGGYWHEAPVSMVEMVAGNRVVAA
jgi:hypothetical protein